MQDDRNDGPPWLADSDGHSDGRRLSDALGALRDIARLLGLTGGSP